MEKKILKLVRYNTGNDKKALLKFKDRFNALIFNATIVAHSGGAVADLVSVHQQKYIIDPQTHIFQHEFDAIKSPITNEIKASIEKYLQELPLGIYRMVKQSKDRVTPKIIEQYKDELVSNVYDFETKYVKKIIASKEYDKYLEFVKVGPEPRLLIAPYFMLKHRYDKEENLKWLDINKNCLQEFIKINNNSFPIAGQLVIDQEILRDKTYLQKIINTFDVEGFEYIFLWIDNYCSFSADDETRVAFFELLSGLTNIKKRAIMAYGGYDSIFLCNSGIKNGLFGVSQSIGYGESRPITPVGGGFPTNKYYFFPLHRRLRFEETASILSSHNYFSDKKTKTEYAKDYFQNICNCPQCHAIVLQNIDNFNQYNDSIPFKIKSRRGEFSRNLPTQDASFASAIHFLYSKTYEWAGVMEKPLRQLVDELTYGYQKYDKGNLASINSWCDIYAK